MDHEANKAPVILMSSKLCHSGEIKLQKYKKEYMFLTSIWLAWSRAQVPVTEYSMMWFKTKFKTKVTYACSCNLGLRIYKPAIMCGGKKKELF